MGQMPFGQSLADEPDWLPAIEPGRHSAFPSSKFSTIIVLPNGKPRIYMITTCTIITIIVIVIIIIIIIIIIVVIVVVLIILT